MAKQFPFFAKTNSWQDEATLIIGIQKGNKAAYEYLDREIFPKIRGFIIAYGGDVEDVEEVYQAATVRLWEKLTDPYFRLTVKVGTYLFSIAKYKWWSEARKRGKHVSYEPDPLYTETDDTDSDPLDDLPFPVFEGSENPFEERNFPSIDEVLEFIKHMGNPCSDLLLDHYFAKVSFEEMVEENQEKPGTIRKRASDCRKKVKKYFKNW